MGSIEVAALTKSFGTGPPVLADLTFRFDGPGAVGYVGPNGAGKTTTLKLLVGLLRPTSGRARLNGIDPMVDRKAALWDVGSLIETPEPYPTLTVHAALDTVGRARGLPRDGVDQEIDRCHLLLDLPPLGERVGRLSKGQRQRVALAAALLGDPSVLLLDEPMSGLDPAERVLVRRLLGQLKRDHLIFLSSHQMLEVSEVCDEVVFLDRGRIRLRDRVDHLTDMVHSRQVDVVFARRVTAEAMASLQRIGASVTAITDVRWRIRFDGAEATRLQLVAACQAMAPVLQFASTALRLEEAYLELIPAPADDA
jgi:ABC-2 type transport system ATP-binding protein